MSGTFNVAKTGASRVFVSEGGSGFSRSPEFQSYLVLGGISQSLGDIESIKAPSDDSYETFEEIDEIIGDAERVESSLTGRYPRNARWNAYEWARKRCAVDVHVHMGTCTNPKAFNDFTKAIVFEGARLTSVNIDEIGSLDENAVVNGSVDFSAKNWYEVLPLVYSERAAALITNEVVAVWTVGRELCATCGEALKLFAATLAAGGSPGTPPDILYSLDKGTTWYAHDIDSMSSAENPSGGAVVGDYVVVVSNGTGSHHYALNSEMDGRTDPTFTEVSTGYVGAPNAIWSVGRKAFVVGDGGYIYTLTEVTTQVTAVETGNATSDRLLAVHALNNDYVLAVGENGAVLLAEDGATFSALTRPVGAGIHLNGCWITAEDEFVVAASDGNLYYTTDGGVSWATRGFSGSGSGQCRAVVFPTKSVGFISHDTSAPRGRVLRTLGGGAADTFFIAPRNSTVTDNDRINALACVDGDPNLILAGGLGADGSDGFLLVGTVA